MFVPISLLIFFICALRRPSSGTCPPHHQVNGINRLGAYTCRPLSTLPDPGSRVVEDKTLDARELQSRIFCASNLVPVVDDSGVRVGCQPRGY